MDSSSGPSSQRPSISSVSSSSDRRPSNTPSHQSDYNAASRHVPGLASASSPSSSGSAHVPQQPIFANAVPGSTSGLVFPGPARSLSHERAAVATASALQMQHHAGADEQEALASTAFDLSHTTTNSGSSSRAHSAAPSRQHSVDEAAHNLFAPTSASMPRTISSSNMSSDTSPSSATGGIGNTGGAGEGSSFAYDLSPGSSYISNAPASGVDRGLASSAEDERYGNEGLQLGSIPEAPGSGANTRRASIATGVGIGIGGIPAMEDQHDLSYRRGEDEFGHGGAFDESVLRQLCDSDCGLPLLVDRIKQSVASSSEAAAFFKKRAAIEEEYARSMIKLARSSSQSYGISDGKAGSYVQSWMSVLRTHELLGDNRLKFAAQLSEISDELSTLGKEVDKVRKASKEHGARLERGLAEQDSLVEKARSRFDTAAEELERLLILKQGESVKDNIVAHSANGAANKRSFGKAMSKLKGPKNPAQVAKQEEEVRSRMGQSSDAYRSQVLGAQSVRQEFFNLQLPRILRSLKESADEVDLGVQYHLSRYAYIFESTLLTDGLTVSPVHFDENARGLKNVIDAIDVRGDFRTFMDQYFISWQMSGQRGPKREGPEDTGITTAPKTLSPRPSNSNLGQQYASARATFGVDLGEQMARDGVEVPRVLEKCCEVIELLGLESVGIYRLSGTTSRVQRLKSLLDRDVEGTDLLSEENSADINDIAGVMKLWFREMPEPLLTWDLYHGFIEAAKIENDRLRHIRLHERVNDLPDPNYATLRYLMGHLDKVRQHESVNQMSCTNLAIVFGPNLLGAPPQTATTAGMASAQQNGSSTLADMQWQCKVIETILQHYAAIFLDDSEA
ncbi:Rho GTPase-activating protein [Microbotryomycetes sp. JL201]|nr:Rho GTPase-activating protein [Microbotryomycetes sp. JL201]